MNKKIKYIFFGILISIIIGLIMGIPTGLIPFTFFGITYVRMIEPTILDYIFLVLISILVGAFVSLHFYSKTNLTSKQEKLVFGGSLFGIFAIGCPICNVLLVSVIGITTILTVFEPLRPIFGIISVTLLGIAVYGKYNNIFCKNCELEK